MATRKINRPNLHFNTSNNNSAHFFNQASRASYFDMHKKALQIFAEVFEHPDINELKVEKAN